MARKGRPRKAGPRYPNGQRVTAGPAKLNGRPTDQVLAKRRAILGKPDAKISETRAAENPLDTMAERGWLDPSLARAGRAYADLYRQAGLYLSRVTANMEEAPETANVDGRRVKDWSPEEIAAVWAVIERRKGMTLAQTEGVDDSGAAANAKLRCIWIGLGPKRASVVNSVCVAQSWPMWAMQFVARDQAPEVNGHLITSCPLKWLRDRAELIEGLTMIRAVISPAKPKAWETESDHPFLGGPVIEEVVEYVDDQGLPDPVLNRAGVAVEVVRRRRAG